MPKTSEQYRKPDRPEANKQLERKLQALAQRMDQTLTCLAKTRKVTVADVLKAWADLVKDDGVENEYFPPVVSEMENLASKHIEVALEAIPEWYNS